MTLRNYTNTSVQTTLMSGIDDIETSLIVADATGYPSAPFAIVIDPDSATSEEVLLVTAAAGPLFTVTRAYDGTTGKAHSAGATVIHAAIAADFVDGQVAGSDTQVQFNNSSTFAGAPSLTYDSATEATLLQGQANHTASFGPELLENPTLVDNADGRTLGTGWTWLPLNAAFGHDPLETAVLSTDALVAGPDQLILVKFSVFGQTQGALQVSIGLDSSVVVRETYAIVSGNIDYAITDHAVVLTGLGDGGYLFFNPLPDGYTDVFDGSIYGFSATAITVADPVLRSSLVDGGDGSLEVVLGELNSLLVGRLAGEASGPSAFGNLALGPSALRVAAQPSNNVAIGIRALESGTNASANLAIGADALHYGHEAQFNVAIGASALRYGYSAAANTAIGQGTLQNANDASETIAIGANAGSNLVHGIGNVLIGNNAGSDLTDADHQLRVGSGAAPLIAGDFAAQTLTIGGDLSVVSGKHYLIEDEDAPGTFYKLKVNSGVLSVEVA